MDAPKNYQSLRDKRKFFKFPYFGCILDKMGKLLFILLSILLFCGSLIAQAECPKISLTGPSGVTLPSDSVTFTATVEPAVKDLKYKWSVSSGKILEGQGTTSISVATEKTRDGFNLTTTVEIVGLPTGCPNTMSETGSTTICYAPELLDEFRGPITVKHKIRVESAEVRLHNSTTDWLVIVLYYKSIRQRETDKRTILKYFHPFVKARIIFVDGPDRGDGPFLRVWLVQAGAEYPEP